MYGTNAESCQYLLWHVARAARRASRIFRLLFLGNGLADCTEIWYALGDPLVTAYAVVTGEVSLHVHTALLYLGNGLADCAQMWCVSLVSLTKCFTQVMGGVYPHPTYADAHVRLQSRCLRNR